MRTDPDFRTDTAFGGAKAALICGPRLVVLRRDDIPTIPYPNRIDLPGGGREGAETPPECAARETAEEVALAIAPDRFTWGRPARTEAGARVWLLVAHISAAEAEQIHIGTEGQSCWMMEIAAYLADPEAIPHMQAGLRAYLDNCG